MANYSDYTMPRTNFSVDPVQAAEDELRRAMMAGRRPVSPSTVAQPQQQPAVLPRARQSAGGTITSNAGQDELGSGRQMLNRALSQLRAPVDVAALNEFAQQRAREGDSSMLNALAAQFAGEQFQPVQAQYLKRAAAAQEPMKVGNYGTIAGGRFVADPYAQRDVEADALLTVGGKLLDNEEAAMREARLARAYASGGSGPRYQQSDTMVLPNGQIVKSRFNPQTGDYEIQGEGGWTSAPTGARPGTASMGGPLAASAFNNLVTDLGSEKSALRKLQKYEDTMGDANIGVQRWADQVAVNAKTLFGSEELTPKQLASMEGPAQLQALLGLFRVDIVGPGVMTEYDAQRVIQALGGNFDALQNPEVVRNILQDIRAGKERRIAEMERQVQYSAPFFPGVYDPNIYQTNEIQGTQEFGAPPPGAVRRK